jgi:hypothetical protein
VSFLRRLFGGGSEEGEAAPDAPPVSQAELEAEEQARDRELLRDEAARMDELRQRQLRYADRAWTPPAQGGERRADDEEAAGKG